MGFCTFCIVTYTSRAKRSEPSAHMDQRCFVGFLLYADFAFQCHSRSCCSLVKFIGSRWSLKSSWAERDSPFFLFWCLPAAWSTCRMLWDVRHGVCCLYSLVFSLWVFFFFPRLIKKKKKFLLIFLTFWMQLIIFPSINEAYLGVCMYVFHYINL